MIVNCRKKFDWDMGILYTIRVEETFLVGAVVDVPQVFSKIFGGMLYEKKDLCSKKRRKNRYL